MIFLQYIQYHINMEHNHFSAVEAIGGIFILSVFATKSYEEIAAAAPNVRRWFQFYMHKDRQVKEKAGDGRRLITDKIIS